MTDKKIALVTGSNKGIGFETARQLAQRDIKVLMGARDEEKGTEAVDRLRQEELDVDFVQLDVTHPEEIVQVRDDIQRRFGRLDILVNNAGMAHPDEINNAASAATISPSVLRETFAVNFLGLVELTQVVLPLLKNSSAGRIVNVSSILGSLTLHSDPEGGLEDFKPFAYDASKTAVNQFTVHLAALLKDTPIKVNSVHPGWVKTDLGGQNAPLDPAEGAKTSVEMATLDEDGPTGQFYHQGNVIPW